MSNVRYISDDVDAAIKFYTEHLDFEVEIHPAPGFAALVRDDLRLLINAPGSGGAGQAGPAGMPQAGGWNRIQITVDDLESLHLRLQKKGARFANPVVMGQGGKQVLLQDPAGNLVELFEPAKSRSVKPIPEGSQTVMPFLCVEDVGKLISFVHKAFDGKAVYAMKSSEGIVRHARIKIGNSLIMVSSGTEIFGSMPCMLHLYVKNVDGAYEQAVKAGGRSLREPSNEFYGDRSAGVADPWNNQWWIATHIEDVDEQELRRREKTFREQRASSNSMDLS